MLFVYLYSWVLCWNIWPWPTIFFFVDNLLIWKFFSCFAVEDVSDLWPLIKKDFEERLPFKKAFLNNKTRNPVFVDELPVEYILTTDARIRSRFPQEQSLFWFREPYATVVLVTCEVPCHILFLMLIFYYLWLYPVIFVKFSDRLRVLVYDYIELPVAIYKG